MNLWPRTLSGLVFYIYDQVWADLLRGRFNFINFIFSIAIQKDELWLKTCDILT